jgi:hypothetical protein
MRRVAIVCTQQKQKENESLRVAAAAAAAASETGSTLPSSSQASFHSQHTQSGPAKEREEERLILAVERGASTSWL